MRMSPPHGGEGKLIPLYKGKGLPSDPSSFRSIFVSDFTAKLYHACLRRPLERAWTASFALDAIWRQARMWR